MRKTTHGLDGQQQYVDKTLRGRVNQYDRRQKNEERGDYWSGHRKNSQLAIITVTVIIAYAANVAIVPVARSIASWLFLRWPDQYHLPMKKVRPWCGQPPDQGWYWQKNRTVNSIKAVKHWTDTEDSIHKFYLFEVRSKGPILASNMLHKYNVASSKH